MVDKLKKLTLSCQSEVKGEELTVDLIVNEVNISLSIYICSNRLLRTLQAKWYRQKGI